MLVKKIMVFRILIFLCSTLLFIQGQCQQADSTWKDAVFYYSDGSKSSEGKLRNNKPDGYWKNYYPWGTLKSEGNRVNYQLEGTWKFYNANEDLTSTIDYLKGKKHGKIITYSDSCYKILEETMVNDVKHGDEIAYFDEKGEIVKEITPYQEGLKDGLSMEFNRKGTIITLTNYRHGFLKNKEFINRSDELGKQGTWKEFYNNGGLKRSMRYKDDVLNGYFKEYDRNGKLLEAILYINGVIQQEEDLLSKLEVQKTYFPNGQVKSEGGYDYDGLKQGSHIIYNEKGEVQEAEIYSNDILLAKGQLNEDGQRIGYWEEYYEDGEIKSKGKYRDGVKVGDWIYFFVNGKVEQKGKYTRDGAPNGKWIWYYDNGSILREENYYKGLEDGDFAEYDPTGKVITKGVYLEGKKDGFWFYELGDYREEGNYREGRREELWKHYYNNGQLLFSGVYIDGNAEGKHRYYYENGILKREENYSVGQAEGIWKSYDANGDLFLTTVYKNGREYKLDSKKLKD